MASPKCTHGAVFRSSVFLGETSLKESEIIEIATKLIEKFNVDNFHLVNHNWSHFCNDFSELLVGKPIPDWASNLAKFIHYMKPLITGTFEEFWMNDLELKKQAQKLKAKLSKSGKSKSSKKVGAGKIDDSKIPPKPTGAEDLELLDFFDDPTATSSTGPVLQIKTVSSSPPTFEPILEESSTDNTKLDFLKLKSKLESQILYFPNESAKLKIPLSDHTHNAPEAMSFSPHSEAEDPLLSSEIVDFKSSDSSPNLDKKDTESILSDNDRSEDDTSSSSGLPSPKFFKKKDTKKKLKEEAKSDGPHITRSPSLPTKKTKSNSRNALIIEGDANIKAASSDSILQKNKISPTTGKLSEDKSLGLSTSHGGTKSRSSSVNSQTSNSANPSPRFAFITPPSSPKVAPSKSKDGPFKSSASSPNFDQNLIKQLQQIHQNPNPNHSHTTQSAPISITPPSPPPPQSHSKQLSRSKSTKDAKQKISSPKKSSVGSAGSGSGSSSSGGSSPKSGVFDPIPLSTLSQFNVMKPKSTQKNSSKLEDFMSLAELITYEKGGSDKIVRSVPVNIEREDMKYVFLITLRELGLEVHLRDPIGYQNFEIYGKQKFFEEAIHFWHAVDNLYREYSLNKAMDYRPRVLEIYENFLTPTAKEEVNVASSALTPVNNAIKNNTFDVFVFDECLFAIITLMNDNSIDYFSSPQYSDYVEMKLKNLTTNSNNNYNNNVWIPDGIEFMTAKQRVYLTKIFKTIEKEKGKVSHQNIADALEVELNRVNFLPICPVYLLGKLMEYEKAQRPLQEIINIEYLLSNYQKFHHQMHESIEFLLTEKEETSSKKGKLRSLLRKKY
eukprot:TRINITY_DN1648_c0_g1_i1.p1 TRINITY_DN1648_c0_g1~~TRINITY_DN1648_c0_g1_i1.p1  ORF type:complete len:838 (-),score=159.83 TRINITY_DN1648_c0_g1_i1:126-2639(-)